MDKPSIGIDYTPAYEQGGGIGRYVRELVAALADQDKATDYRLFVTGASTRALPPLPGANFRWALSRISPAWFARVWHRARLPIPVEWWTGPLVLFHATDFVLPPTHASTRTVLTVHDLSFARAPEAASPSLKRYLDRVVPRSIERADHVLADSQATRDDLIALYGVKTDKITVLLSGVNPRFQPIRDAETLSTVRARYQIGDVPYILAIGTIQPRKNFERLMQAFAMLPSDLGTHHLVIAGGHGWLQAPIYAAVKTLGLQGRVHFIGFTDDKDLPALYSAARCLAFPSLYEGFGLPVLEAMACGIPVATSNVSSLLEVAGDAALLVNPLSTEQITAALVRLLTDEPLRSDLIARGYSQARRFSWDQSALQLQQVYAAVLKRN
jgi:glycosyltransferase involved in cell wall biosynthesis